jgi:hypothetical protein
MVKWEVIHSHPNLLGECSGEGRIPEPLTPNCAQMRIANDLLPADGTMFVGMFLQ